MRKSKKSLIITADAAKRGVKIAHSFRVSEIPFRKLRMDTLQQVRFGRRPVVVTDYGKPLAVILPLADQTNSEDGS